MPRKSKPTASKSTQRLVLAVNDRTHKPFLCALCNGRTEVHEHFIVLVEGGGKVCWECVKALEPSFAFLTDVFHELCNTACNELEIEDGNEPYYELEWSDLPIELCFAALDAAYPDKDTLQ